MFNVNITIRCLLLLIIAWPGPRPVVHSHADYLNQCGNSSLLAMHMRIFHPENSSNPGVPCLPHCHWVCSGCDFDKTIPIKFIDGLNVSSTVLEDLPDNQMSTGFAGLGLLPLNETARPSLGSTQFQACFRQPDLDYHQLYCIWTC